MRIKFKHGIEVYLNGKLVDKLGDLYGCKEGDLIVDNGIAGITAVLGGLDSAFTYMAIGTDDTSPQSTDTTLGNETHREQATISRETTTKTNDTLVFTRTFSGYTGQETIKECGIFNASSGGYMLCRILTGSKYRDWDAGDTLQIIVKVQVTTS